MSESCNLDLRDPKRELEAAAAPYYGMYLLDTERRLVVPLKPTPDNEAMVGTPVGVLDWDLPKLAEELFSEQDLGPLQASLSPEAVQGAFAQQAERRVLQYRRKDGNWVKLAVQPYAMEKGRTRLALLTHMRIAAPVEGRPMEDPSSVRIRVNLSTDRMSFVNLREGQTTETPGATSWSDAYQMLVQAVHPDDRNAVVMKTHPSILKGLPDGDELTCTFRALYHNEYVRYFMGIHKYTEGGSQLLKLFIESIRDTAAAE